MNVLVELKSIITESRLVSFELPDYVKKLPVEEQKKFIIRLVNFRQVEFLSNSPGTVSAVKFTHEIKDMDYKPKEGSVND